jgi:hypothetical protein
LKNYFATRFGNEGRSFINYQGKDILLLTGRVYDRYKDMFIKSDIKKADMVTIINGIPKPFKLNPYVTLGSILKTQRNSALFDYINNRYNFILDMELRACMSCVKCFNKRDKHSIVYSLCMDNVMMNLADESEPSVSENIIRYIETKYSELGRYYIMQKQGLIKVWMK